MKNLNNAGRGMATAPLVKGVLNVAVLAAMLGLAACGGGGIGDAVPLALTETPASAPDTPTPWNNAPDMSGELVVQPADTSSQGEDPAVPPIADGSEGAPSDDATTEVPPVPVADVEEPGEVPPVADDSTGEVPPVADNSGTVDVPPVADNDGTTADKPAALPVTGSIDISWRAPTERENGEALALADMSGYRIHYGPLNNPDANQAYVDDPLVTTYQVDGLPAGTYQVTITALDRDGLESAHSNAMSKTIQ